MERTAWDMGASLDIFHLHGEIWDTLRCACFLVDLWTPMCVWWGGWQAWLFETQVPIFWKGFFTKKVIHRVSVMRLYLAHLLTSLLGAWSYRTHIKYYLWIWRNREIMCMYFSSLFWQNVKLQWAIQHPFFNRSCFRSRGATQVDNWRLNWPLSG